MNNKQIKTFSEQFGTKGGMQGLEYIEERSRDKFLDLDIKLPEFFALISSIFIAYLSTITKTNIGFFLSFACFSTIVFLSLITLWMLKRLHLQTATQAKESLTALRELREKYKKKLENPDLFNLYKEELGKIEIEKTKAYKIIGQKRKTIELFLLLEFALFVIGLFLIVFSQALW